MNTSLVPVLETDRLWLRGHRTEDFSASAAMWSDPKVVAHISGTPSTVEQSWSRFLRYTGHWQHMSFGYWVVERKADQAFIGEVGFADYRRDTKPSLDGQPEAGWVLKADAHGQGFATEAVGAALGWADQHIAAAQTACIFDPAHAPSINVGRKLGYGDDTIGTYAGQPTLFLYRGRKTSCAAPS